jgi:hypothetical protein
VPWAWFLTRSRAGKDRAANRQIALMTTSNSTSVSPLLAIKSSYTGTTGWQIHSQKMLTEFY